MKCYLSVPLQLYCYANLRMNAGREEGHCPSDTDGNINSIIKQSGTQHFVLFHLLHEYLLNKNGNANAKKQ